MSLGLSDSRNRRRRQGRLILALLRWVFVIAVAMLPVPWESLRYRDGYPRTEREFISQHP